MAAPAPILPLGNLTGGINTFQREAAPGQAAEAENVMEDDGYLVRRPAFSSIATAPPFILPGGLVTTMRYRFDTGAWDTFSARLVNSSVSLVGGSAGILLIGADVQFDGIDWKRVLQPAALTGRQYLRPQFVNTTWTSPAVPPDASFTDFSWFLDTTRWVAGDDDAQPLMQDGRISWHRDKYASWPQVTLNSLTKYWVALNITNDPPDFDSQTFGAKTALLGNAGGTLVLRQPGARVFQLERVTGIFPVKQNGVARTFVMSDRSKRRGQERGAQIGVVQNPSKETEILHLSVDEGSGVLGEVTKGSTWSNTGVETATADVFGAASVLTKFDERYSWRYNQFGGDVLQHNFAASSPTTNTITFTPTNSSYETEFENMILEVTTSGGVTAGQLYRIIKSTVSGSDVVLTVAPAFSATPTGAARFRINSREYSVSPETEAAPSGTLGPSRSYYHFSVWPRTVNAHTLQLLAAFGGGRPDDVDEILNANINNSFVNWAIDRETRWDIPSEHHWSCSFDTLLREFYLSNGAYPIMRWDTKRLRRLEALADADDERVLDYIGSLTTLSEESIIPAQFASDQLRANPPYGKYIVDYHGRLVVAGIPGLDWHVMWSGPTIYNDIWLRAHETQVRDPDNQPISGMTVLNDQIVIWTPSSIHAASFPSDSGNLAVGVKSRGIGFIAHHAVDRLSVDNSAVLMGVNSDGLYAYNGAEATAVVDEWKRIIPGGINPAALNKAVAKAALLENVLYVAIAGAGSNVNNYVIRFDWVNKTAYLFTAPFGGISFIAREMDSVGRERMLFGTEDGHVCALEKRERDDGQVITAKAKSVNIQVDSTTQNHQAIMVTAAETGASQNLTFKAYINQRIPAMQTFTGPFDQGSSLYGSGVYGTSLFGGTGFRTRKVPLPVGLRAEGFQYEIESTKPFRLRSVDVLVRPISQRSR